MRYRVREALLAVRSEPHLQPEFITIEPGSVILMKGREELSGFVEISHLGQNVKVYMRDLEKRSDRVECQTGG
jgi:hypothetical protein